MFWAISDPLILSHLPTSWFLNLPVTISKCKQHWKLLMAWAWLMLDWVGLGFNLSTLSTASFEKKVHVDICYQILCSLLPAMLIWRRGEDRQNHQQCEPPHGWCHLMSHGPWVITVVTALLMIRSDQIRSGQSVVIEWVTRSTARDRRGVSTGGGSWAWLDDAKHIYSKYWNWIDCNTF